MVGGYCCHECCSLLLLTFSTCQGASLCDHANHINHSVGNSTGGVFIQLSDFPERFTSSPAENRQISEENQYGRATTPKWLSDLEQQTTFIIQVSKDLYYQTKMGAKIRQLRSVWCHLHRNENQHWVCKWWPLVTPWKKQKNSGLRFEPCGAQNVILSKESLSKI